MSQHAEADSGFTRQAALAVYVFVVGILAVTLGEFAAELGPERGHGLLRSVPPVLVTLAVAVGAGWMYGPLLRLLLNARQSDSV